MTDRPKTWTDGELRKARPCNTDGYPLILGTLEHRRAYLKNLGAIHPHESREREREAWDAATHHCLNLRFSVTTPIPPSPVERDRLYPSLTPPTPPALRLSTGVTIKRAGGERFEIILSNGTPHWGNTISSLGAFCLTAQDFTDIAKWLEATP